nr:tail fiber protein [Winogradskyella wandonensis]
MLGEIKLFAGNFAPRGWAFCHGQLLPISKYSAVFSLLGTTYGGDGRTTFALPDLRGRVPVSPGTGPGHSPVKLGQISNGKSVNESDSGNAKTQSTLGLNYIICIQGFYPSRS